MKLLILRHAPAEDREIFATTGEPDESRPLTDIGRKKMRKATRGLHGVVPQIDLLATSPLIRAAETARIIGDAYGGLTVAEAQELAPGHAPESVLSWLKTQKGHDTVAVVGHEPDLGHLVSWLLSGKKQPFIELKKGAACLIEFPNGIVQGKAILIWALAPSQLRALGG
ncbi:MAG: histidine phosphatase family protein [Gammaproteobacteria bacterium]|jgi:phosphohistidine phosphatase|nr:histidine phosphatase family protein [Gammaproteobacteria bacterium]